MKNRHTKQGQALVLLLIFMAVAVTITSAAVAMSVINIQSTTDYITSEKALRVAETGAENAMIKLLRDPSYAGETLPVGTGTAIVNVSGDPTKTIVSEGTSGTYKRKVQVVGTFSGTDFTVQSWAEIQ